MNRYICIHGHFYQPPRENPWLEEVEVQDSAYPYHDWNSRITAECYAPNAVSRILDSDRHIIDIVNNYSRMSFNFGPTLLSWMQRHSPGIYQAVVDADRAGRERFSGHGTAMAQGYSHMILPLANSRDKRTQIIWGIRDFESRFKRKPEGMWLPEAAVDLETLGILAEQGILFTVLAPGQARHVRLIGEESWQDVSGARIDPKMPYLCRLASGKTIAIFFYDGPISHDIAFGSLLSRGEDFSGRLKSVFDPARESSQLSHTATDGETYGHHHRFGEMALAYCLYLIESGQDAKLTVYGEYLAKYPPSHEVEIFEQSSWSCMHGVERWRGDCGCNSGSGRPWHQKWRAPLRGAFDWLRDNLIQIFESQAGRYFSDPWLARDEYIGVILDRSNESVDAFLGKHAVGALSEEEKVKALKLFEMQRNCMLMYTSCGWFFDEISGIETVQVMRYAARAMQLAQEVSGMALEETFLSLLERAPSNLPEYATGRKVYDLLVKPAVLDLLRVGMHYAVSSLFQKYSEIAEVYSYTARSRAYVLEQLGHQRLAVGRVHVRSKITREEGMVSFAVLHFGDHNLIGSAGVFDQEESYAAMSAQVREVFLKGDLPEVVRLMEKNFSNGSYSLWHLFKDEQRRIVREVFESAVKDIDASFAQLFEHNVAILQASEMLKAPLPKAFAFVVEYQLNKDIMESLSGDEVNVQKLKSTFEQISRFSLNLDQAMIGYVIGDKITRLLERFADNIGDIAALEQAANVLGIVERLSLDLNLWRAQNVYFSVGKKELPRMRERAQAGDAGAGEWQERFNALGEYLKVKIT